MENLAFAAFNNSTKERLMSSSGGMFILLARQILSWGGVVYGVSMSPKCDFAEYVRAQDFGAIFPLLRSKYMQARVGSTFKRVQEDLENRLPVLFTGTGCQINGLKCYLNKNYDNLYAVDVVCHGVPSPMLWRKYIGWIENKYQSEIKSVNFRCKDSGWADFGIKKITDRRKQIFTSQKMDPYMQMFLKNYCLRPSCYECAAKKYKLADMSIADFWGIEDVVPEMNDNKGISMVIVRTEQGKKLFRAIEKDISYLTIEYKDAIKKNPAEFSSVVRPEQRNDFFEDMIAMNFGDLSQKYVPIPFKRKVKNIILKTPLKNLIGGGINQKSNVDYGLLFTFADKEKC